jgi:UDP-N-acetylglucosamine 2-epimerase (non-hydrolysing)
VSPIYLILGIRPDVIRASLLIKKLKEMLPNDFKFIWAGQHYSDNMKDIFFRQLDVPKPDITLNTQTGSDIKYISSLMLELESLFNSTRPQAVIFLGDTNTVLGSISAAAANIPILHIEGCMRSYDWRMPEEKYRTIIDHLSDIIYAYTEEYKSQGISEGLDQRNIIVTGNPIVDVIDHFFKSGKIRMASTELEELNKNLNIVESEYYLMTCHRRENIEDLKSLSNIINLAGNFDKKVIFIAGYGTQEKIKLFDVKIPSNVQIIDPIGYVEILELVTGSRGVFTDSGTLVEECSILNVPSIQLRISTERPEVYDVGGSLKFDPNLDYTTDQINKLINKFSSLYGKKWKHALGSGDASSVIAKDIFEKFKNNNFRFRGASHSNHRARNYGTGNGNLGDFL